MIRRLALLLLAFGISCIVLPAKGRPNVVFFLVDDLGWTDLACFGSSFYETPNIDRLAKQGMRFTNAYSTCHVCSPSRASLLTGKYPARLHLTDWLTGRREFPFQSLRMPKIKQTLAPSETTLPEALKAHQYSTAIFGKWHAGEAPLGPYANGFDLHTPKGWMKGWPKAGYHAPFKFPDIPEKPGDYLTDNLTTQALRWLDKEKDNPFFLYLSFFTVHDPIQGHPDLVQKYEKKRTQLSPSSPPFILEGNPDDRAPLSRKRLTQLLDQPSHAPHRVLPHRTVKIKQQQDNPQFAAMVESLDQNIGRVLKRLDELKLTDNTIIVFTADNGGMSAANFGNPKRIVPEDKLDTAYSTANLPLRGAKGWLYEGGIRVPTIVKWPGHTKADSTCPAPIIGTDFYPTLLDLLELDPLPDQTLDGHSFADALLGKSWKRPSPLFWHFPHYSNHGMQSPAGAIRDGDFKLIEYFENGSLQLFNLRDDIGEQRNLAASNPKKAKALQEKLQIWQKRVEAQMMAPNPNYDPAEYPWKKRSSN